MSDTHTTHSQTKRATKTLSFLKHWSIPLFSIFGIICGLIVSLVVYNMLERQKEVKYEITFIDPHQAIVFWKTDSPSIGYVKYGPTRKDMNMRAEQTSSTPSEIHAVVLEDVPLEGFSISMHTDGDSPFLWDRPIDITFDPSTIEE